MTESQFTNNIVNSTNVQTNVIIKPLIDSKIVTDVIILLDQSGSMATMQQEAIQSATIFIKTQTTVDETAKFSLSTFSTIVKNIIVDVPFNKVPPLVESDFVPYGGTALYDAIGMTIQHQKQVNQNNKVVLIITDGLDNSSQSYTKKQIKILITEMKKKNWKFIFMGANINAYEEGNNIDINTNQCAQFNKYNLETMTRSVSDHISNFRREYSQGHKDAVINLELEKTSTQYVDQSNMQFTPKMTT